MPSHKAKFKWGRRKVEITDQRVVKNEHGTFKVGGIKTETRPCSRGGVFICKLRSAVNVDDFSNPVGVWSLERADGSVHSHGEVHAWSAPYPSIETLEEIAAGA